ncbi:hypothetical protein XFF6990_10185 [Xanthomonas citri pv. fuscans]|nr:hypothetical protein XFF6990_10185 [Xanthomonas citri pv. fuscans]
MRYDSQSRRSQRLQKCGLFNTLASGAPRSGGLNELLGAMPQWKAARKQFNFREHANAIAAT